ncbi:hypothetical protein SETIT_9G480800v2 [Setaria italica]|uniref:Uncharacterized protein n=1 Tax=Setaria italica TaxID=4555 RepID=A0A368STS1_SETIT|nr:hypothetical protein SETIT_9G480800v2 [Setaria italica]
MAIRILEQDCKRIPWTYNYTSNQLTDPTQVENGDKVENMEVLNSDLQETMAGREDDDVMVLEDDQMRQRRDATVTKNTENDERVVHSSQRRAATVTRNTEEREPKRQKKISNLEGLMERYIGMRTKQGEDEAVQLAREKEESEGNAFSIKKCISVLNTLEVTKEEKAKSFKLFKDPDNRQILSACDDDPEVALLWLRSEIA